MDLDLARAPRHSSSYRSSSGCWTCRLRRKKCDEHHPVCEACAALDITCHGYSQQKPEWMDGGGRQDERAEWFKSEIKERSRVHGRRWESAVQTSNHGHDSVSESTASEHAEITDGGSILESTEATYDDDHGAHALPQQRGADCTSNKCKNPRGSIHFSRCDTILSAFYIEHVLPFLFPFYRPSITEGGRGWILEMMISSPVLRQAMLCLSAHLFSLAQKTGPADYAVANNASEVVLAQTEITFRMLRQSLHVIETGAIFDEHLHGAVRIMASIMQLQRFEVAVSSFANCQAHLGAASALFQQLLNSAGEPAQPRASFDSVVHRLGPAMPIPRTQSLTVPSAEQAAFRFSAALLIFDDIIASTMLQDEPMLYRYHGSLIGGQNPPIDLEEVVGCQNWVLLQVGEIAALDVWKQSCKNAGNLDVMQLVHRATGVKEALKAELLRFDSNSMNSTPKEYSLLDTFTADQYRQSTSMASQSSTVTRVWAHAAFLYLFVVVSGWQPSNDELRIHVSDILSLVLHQSSPPAMLRTVVWPFCVAGCLAEPAQRPQFFAIVEALQPPSVFGTVVKALDIMRDAWRNTDVEGDAANRDLATCFKGQEKLVLLV